MNTTKSLLINDSFWRMTAEGDPLAGRDPLKMDKEALRGFIAYLKAQDKTCTLFIDFTSRCCGSGLPKCVAMRRYALKSCKHIAPYRIESRNNVEISWERSRTKGLIKFFNY